jgi:DNA-binding beta-propeller fold protein YncE
MGLRPSMKLLRVVKATLVCSLVVVLALDLGIAQNISGSSVAAPSTITVTQGLNGLQPVRAFPSIPLWSSHVLTYLGVFSPDATFHTTSKFTGTTGSSPGEGILPKDYQAHGQPDSAAPASMLLSNERVVENLEPPAHAEAAPQSPARVAELRNRFVTYAYGRPSVLSAPTHVATDSRQRLIVSDPLGDAVHVLDPAGKTSFRIVTGKGYRLHQPAGVAVDASDNIYVADSERGMVAVFDRSGNFQRYIGNFKGENEYQSPDGIAIDRKAGRLYLVDSPRSLVFVLDLSGNVLHRLGRYHDGTGEGKFDDPIDVAFDHNHVYVLDNSGTRVQILDSKGAFLSSFNLPLGFGPQVARDNGLCVDQQGYIYVSLASLATIRVYSHDGRPLASFGQIGKRAGEFAKPEGLWIDSSNRIYVADSGNGRIQLFQLDAQK